MAKDRCKEHSVFAKKIDLLKSNSVAYNKWLPKIDEARYLLLETPALTESGDVSNNFTMTLTDVVFPATTELPTESTTDFVMFVEAKIEAAVVAAFAACQSPADSKSGAVS